MISPNHALKKNYNAEGQNASSTSNRIFLIKGNLKKTYCANCGSVIEEFTYCKDCNASVPFAKIVEITLEEFEHWKMLINNWKCGCKVCENLLKKLEGL